MVGKFITFEGPEGAGKSTQIKLLSQYFTDHNIKHIITREPGGTQLAEQLRNIVKHCDYEKIDDRTEVLLFAAARSQHYHNVIKPNLENGVIVLCDRFIDSTYVYQGFGRGINHTALESINKFILQDALPDLTIVINIPIDETLKRIEKRNLNNKDTDRFENVDYNFFQLVHDGFDRIADLYKNRIIVLDGTQSILQLNQNIIQCINNRFNLLTTEA